MTGLPARMVTTVLMLAFGLGSHQARHATPAHARNLSLFGEMADSSRIGGGNKDIPGETVF